MQKTPSVPISSVKKIKLILNPNYFSENYYCCCGPNILYNSVLPLIINHLIEVSELHNSTFKIVHVCLCFGLIALD